MKFITMRTSSPTKKRPPWQLTRAAPRSIHLQMMVLRDLPPRRRKNQKKTSSAESWPWKTSLFEERRCRKCMAAALWRKMTKWSSWRNAASRSCKTSRSRRREGCVKRRSELSTRGRGMRRRHWSKRRGKLNKSLQVPRNRKLKSLRLKKRMSNQHLKRKRL